MIIFGKNLRCGSEEQGDGDGQWHEGGRPTGRGTAPLSPCRPIVKVVTITDEKCQRQRLQWRTVGGQIGGRAGGWADGRTDGRTRKRHIWCESYVLRVVCGSAPSRLWELYGS